ncbi:MAG: nuclease A inhibitor family protein [Byssovorax sp.]
MIKSKPAAPLLETLGKATQGLLFPSESDCPLTPYTFPGAKGAEPTPAALLAAEHLPGDTVVETLTVADLFEPFATAADDASAEDKAEAARYRAIVDLLGKELTDLRVLRVGKVDIDVYILGKDPTGAWIGLKTHVVET